MGGRGASSGISVKGKVYGTEYTTVYKSGNIKFVVSNSETTNAPMETMTRGRVYVTIDKNTNKIKSISYYDNSGKRTKQIDMSHYHKINGNKENPHTHIGYFHNENGDRLPTPKEKKIIDRVERIWYYYNEDKNKK